MSEYTALLGLVETLAKKTDFRNGTEAMVYMAGLSFAENLFKFNTLILEGQINDLKERDDENYSNRGATKAL